MISILIKDILIILGIIILGYIGFKLLLKYSPLKMMAPYIKQEVLILKGEVVEVTLKDNVTGIDNKVKVYLPENYNDCQADYPVIYHLHGARPKKFKFDVASPDLYYTAQFLEESIEKGIANKSIIVAPYATDSMSLWSNSKDGKIRDESFLIDQLIPYMDENYNTLVDRDNRFIQGFSMGGFGAIKAIVKYPHLFKKAISYDGAIHTWSTLTEKRKNIATTIFDNDEAYFDQYSVNNVIKKNQFQLKEIEILIYVGMVKDYNKTLKNTLASTDLSYEYIVTEFGHSMIDIITKYKDKSFGFIFDNQ